jgi:phosphoenolpyruvate-protein kinase (PTS system EI component)
MRCAHLYNPFHLAIKTSKNENCGHMPRKEVGIAEKCRNPTYSVVLWDWGLTIQYVCGTYSKDKKIIRSVSKKEAQDLVDELLQCSTSAEILTVMKKIKYRN